MKVKLPVFPRTPHLPYKVGEVAKDDIIAEQADVENLLDIEVTIDEKIDGANCAMMLGEDGHPLLRNRNNMLRKSYLKDTPAKKQFRPLWNWFYDNKNLFDNINEAFDGPVGVYGEWLWALHGIRYDTLKSYFVAYEIFDPYLQKFVNYMYGRAQLQDAGFIVPPLLHKGSIVSWNKLDSLVEEKSRWSTLDQIEGLYIRISNNEEITHRFKFIRPGYIQGGRWDDKEIVKQVLGI